MDRVAYEALDLSRDKVLLRINGADVEWLMDKLNLGWIVSCDVSLAGVITLLAHWTDCSSKCHHHHHNSFIVLKKKEHDHWTLERLEERSQWISCLVWEVFGEGSRPARLAGGPKTSITISHNVNAGNSSILKPVSNDIHLGFCAAVRHFSLFLTYP